MMRNLLSLIVLIGLWGSLRAQFVSSPVSVDSRSLNTGHQVGSIQASLTASPNGSANYQIPIQVAPGINGLLPNLSINYNSGSSNGLLGYGVHLSGISFISRGANSFMQDGNSKKVDFNTSDALYLGGNRLILVSGSYGADNSEYRLDNSNKVRVKLYGSGTSIYFKVWTPNGRIYLYGSDSNTRLSGSNGILRWYVKSISDYDGNSINYTYSNDTYGFRINQINYAGNSISFEYASRDDKISKYFEGVEIKQHKILSKIKVNGQGSRFKEYQFSYFKDKYSHLNEVKLLGTDGKQVNSTVLNWGNSESFSRISTATNKNTYFKKYADFNGDGRMDYVEYPSKSTYTINDIYKVYITSNDGRSQTMIFSGKLRNECPGIQVTDINGDGKDDIFFAGTKPHSSLPEKAYYLEYIHYEDGTLRSKEINLGYDHEDAQNAICIDLNGDNVKEVLVFKGGNSFVYDLETDTKKNVSGLPSVISTDVIREFNFNGACNLMIVTGSDSRIYEFNGNSTFSVCYDRDIFNKNDDYIIADFNGDGIDDILINTDNNILNNADKKIFYGNGSGFTEKPYPIVWDNDNSHVKSKEILTGDFNGDGISDILQIAIVVTNFFDTNVNFSRAKVLYGTGGMGFIKKTEVSLNPLEFDEETSHPISSLSYIAVADFNGDNIDDVIFTHNKVSTFQKILSNDSGNENLLVKVADGMNNRYNISYQRANDGDIYSQDASTGDADLYYYQGKSKMLKGISMTSDGKTISNTSYKYKNQTIHKNYGFLGCKEFTQSESVQNSENTSVVEFVGSYYIPALKSNSSKLSGALVASSSRTNNVAKVNGTKGFRLIPYVSYQTQINHLTGVTNTVSYSGFDSYYNPGSISKNLGGVLSETQSISYNNLVNSTYWLPGRLASVTTKQDHTDNAAISTTNKWVYSNHRLSSKTQLYGTPKALTETYTYNSSGLVSSVTVSGSGVTSRSSLFEYDVSKRFVTKETNPLGHVSKATYDPVTGNRLSATDANNRVSSFTYNGFGQLLKSTYPDGTSSTNTTSWNSTLTGCVYKISSSRSGSAPASAYFDRLGREIRSEAVGYNSKTIKIDTRYDSKGRIAAVSLPFSSSKTAEKTYAYDSYGRTSTITLPNGRGSVSYTYSGLTTKVTNPESWKETTIDGAGFVKSVKDPGGQITYDYYSNGLVEDIKFGANIIHHVYDVQGNLTQTTDPDAGTTSAEFDALGQVIRSTTANNHTYTYGYDKLRRITNRTLQSGGETTQWQYDPSGNKGAIHQILLNSKVVESATYDAYGRTSTHTEKIYDGGITKTYTNSYAYNSNGQVSRITYPTGYYVNHSYNSDGMLSEIRDRNNKLIWNNAVTNDMGQFTSYSYGNGAVVSKTYDSWYQPDKISAKVGSRYLSNQDFDFNVKGNLTRRKDILHGNQTEDFNYDAVNRLTTSSRGSDVSYTGDNTGNILTKSDVGTYEYNHSVKKHAVTSIQNPHSSYLPSSESVSYTAFNKVEDIEQNQDGTTRRMEFAYGAGYARKISRLYENGAQKHTMYYTNSNYEVKKDQSSGSEKHYHYITAPSGLAATFISTGGATGDLYFVHADYLGSILGLSNQSGYIAEEYSYDAWGNRRSVSNWNSPDNRTDFLIERGYTMHEHISGFDLINMNGRVYDPKLGRFLSPDPLLQNPGNTQNMNRYSYVWNNPLKYTDPSGYKNQAAVATDNGGEPGQGSYSGNWFGTGGGGSMSWNLGTIYSWDGSLIELGI